MCGWWKKGSRGNPRNFLRKSPFGAAKPGYERGYIKCLDQWHKLHGDDSECFLHISGGVPLGHKGLLIGRLSQKRTVVT